MADEKQEFTPEQIAQFEAYQNYLVDKQNKESATALYPAVGGGAGAAAGAAIGAGKEISKIPGVIKDTIVSAKAPAASAPLTSGDKWAKAIGGPGGVNQDVAVQNRAMQRSLTPKEAAEFKVARSGVVVPNRVESEIAKEAAAKAATIPGRVAGVASGVKNALGPVAPIAGKALALGSAGYDVGDVVDRSNKGQYGRAAVSGLGALGSAASLAPHPIVKGVGMGVAAGAPALNILLDRLAKENPELFEKLHLATGGLVHLASGGELPAFQQADMRYQMAENQVKRNQPVSAKDMAALPAFQQADLKYKTLESQINAGLPVDQKAFAALPAFQQADLKYLMATKKALR